MSMETLKPTDSAQYWSANPVHERIEDCRFMLRVHGFLSDAESDRISKRIEKWLAMHGMRRVER